MIWRSVYIANPDVHDHPPSTTHHQPFELSSSTTYTMGTGKTAAKHGARSKNKKYKRKVWLCNRQKDVDQIQDEIAKGDAHKFEFDDELPGGGQFYCAETGKHFIDAKSLADHKKSKFYKKRVKELKEEKYSQDVADWASGMSKEKLPPAHPTNTES